MQPEPPFEARYGAGTWIGDAVLGGLGTGLLGLWAVVLLPSLWAVLPGLGLVGSLYLLVRMLWLATVVYRVDPSGLSIERRALFVGTERVDLKRIERADLHYLGTLLRGARGKRGLFVLHVADGALGALRIESKVEGFHVIATLVLQAAIGQGRAISLATYDNATALELDVRLRTEMIDRPV